MTSKTGQWNLNPVLGYNLPVSYIRPMNNKDRFESWFLNINRHNGNRTKNIGAFIGYLKKVANDVNKTEGTFYRIPSVVELKEIERLLINSSRFQGRSTHEKSNLKSGLNTYMRFMKWKIDQSLQRSKARQQKASITKLPAETKPKSPLRIKKEKIAQVSPTLLTLKKIDKKRDGFLKIELLGIQL